MIFSIQINDTAVQPYFELENERTSLEHLRIEVWNPDWGTLPNTSINVLSKTDLLLDVEIVIKGEMTEGYTYSIRNMRVEIRQITYSDGLVKDQIVKQETHYNLQPDTLGQVRVTLSLTPQDDPPLGEVGAKYYIGVSGKVNIFVEGEYNPISIESLEQAFTEHFYLETHDPYWGTTLTIKILSTNEELLRVEADVDYSGVDQLYRVPAPVERIHLLVEKETQSGWTTVAGFGLSNPSEGPDDHYRHFINLPDFRWNFPSPEIDIRYKITATATVKVTEETFIITETQETIIEPSSPKISEYIENLKEKITLSDNENWGKKAENRKKTVFHKIDEVLNLYEEGLISEAYDKFLHDIKPKLTGLKEDENGELYGNGVFKKPWVITLELQAEFDSLIDEILEFLQSEIDLL